MNTPWKAAITAVLIGTAISNGGSLVLAADAPQAVAAAPSNYGLTDTIRAAVKSLAVESTTSGTRIAATVRLYNGGTERTRIPDYRLRVRSTDGTEYTLTASSTNKGSLQPNEIGELVYMAVIETGTPVTIDQLSFVEVDEYVYPKKETYLLNIPIDKQVWYSSVTGAVYNTESKAWGEPFTVTGLNSALRYTPVSVEVQYASAGASTSASAASTGAGAASGGASSAAGAAGAAMGASAAAASGSTPAASSAAPASGGTAGRVALVTLLVENPGVGRETIPDFRLDGRTDQKSYMGKRTESGPITVDVGEKKYIRFAIPIDNSAELSSLIVTTTETFVQAGAQGTSPVSTNFDVGRLRITVPAGGQAGQAPAAAYSLGTAIAFDPLNKLIDGNTEVSLMEMHIHDNGDTGYKTAVGKFKLTNKNDIPIPLPAFQTELVGAGGSYAGTRQSNAAATLNPNMSYVVNYSFNVPKSETGEQLVMKLLDTQTSAPYSSTIASVQTTAVDPVANEKIFKMYPFEVTLNNWSMSTLTSGMGASLSFNYKMLVDLGIQQADDVIVDNGFSKLHWELVDTMGRVVGTADSSFTGANKLVSGLQTITFNAKSEQLDYPLTINIYEGFDTPAGQAKRFITSLHQ